MFVPDVKFLQTEGSIVMSESSEKVTKEEKAAPDASAIVESESGARNPTGAVPKKILFYVPLAWTLFQLWYASPLPFIFNLFVNILIVAN